MLLGPNGGIIKSPTGGMRKRNAGGGAGSGKAVLTQSNFNYLGMFKVAQNYNAAYASSDDFGFSRAPLALRKVEGQTRLFTIGKFSTEPLIELIVPNTFSTSLGSAPTALLSRNWGYVYGSSRLIMGEPPGEYPITWGLKWSNGRLYSTYSTGYEGVSHNPALVVSELNDTTGTATTYGPWRANIHSGFFSAALDDVPAWFQAQYGVGPMANLPSIHCAQASTPWGCSNYAFTPPTPATPPDPRFDAGVYSITMTPLASFSKAHPQTRPTNNYKFDYGGSTYTPLLRFGGNDIDLPTLDWCDTGLWIDLPTKHGVVYFGQLVDTIAGYPYGGGDTVTHVWYGADLCAHGQDGKPMYQSTGPGAGSVVNMVWIFNPDDYAAVLNASINPWDIVPNNEFRAHLIDNFVAEKRDNLYLFGGAVFDPDTNRIYISQTRAYTDGYDPVPVIHVLEVTE